MAGVAADPSLLGGLVNVAWGLLVGIGGWFIRSELKMAGLARGQADYAGVAKTVQTQGESLVELRTDVKYIREGIDDLKGRRGRART